MSHDEGINFVNYDKSSHHYSKYEDLEKDFESGKVHPADLKENLTRLLVEELKPISKYFEQNPEAAKLSEQVKSWRN